MTDERLQQIEQLIEESKLVEMMPSSIVRGLAGELRDARAENERLNYRVSEQAGLERRLNVAYDAEAERDQLRAELAAERAKVQAALAVHKPGPMLDHHEYGCTCGFSDHRWSQCEGCGYHLDDEGEFDRGVHGRVCPTVAALTGEASDDA